MFGDRGVKDGVSIVRIFFVGIVLFKKIFFLLGVGIFRSGFEGDWCVLLP